jgi:hypothetical protein
MRTGRMTIINNDIYMIKHDTHGVWMMDDGWLLHHYYCD